MDLSMLPNPVSEYDKQRTGARFTVRSANSPSYSLTRRPGVRKPRGCSEEKESADNVGDREGYGMKTGTNGTHKEEDRTATGYQARTGSVKGQSEELETSKHQKLNQNGAETITEFGTDRSGSFKPASESRGRTDWRRYELPSRTQSLDRRAGTSSPDQGKMADMLSTRRGLDERRAGLSWRLQAYNFAGTSNVRDPVSQMSQTVDRASRGHSLPIRLRSLSGPGSSVIGAASSLGPQGGQSIMERIEKLYGSAGLGKTEDFSKSRDYSTFKHDRASGGTFPRRFSSGERSSLSPVQSRLSFTWTQKDTSSSDALLSPGPSRTRQRLSAVQWQGPTQGRFSEEGGDNWGTRSLDRVRSRYSVAAQIRSARAAAGNTSPLLSNTFSGAERSASLRDLSVLRERRASGSKNQGEVKGETNGTNETLRERTVWLEEQENDTDDGSKEKTELKCSSTDEDVFESNPQKITVKTTERKKVPERLSSSSAVSVRNKINQFEALSQRTQGLATGQALMPRRAFSVPTQLSRAHDGVKKSGSAKAIGGSRYKGLKEGEEAGYEMEEKATGAGKKLGSNRSLSVDEVGLRLGQREREGDDLDDNEGEDSGDNHGKDLGEYSRFKSTLEIPLNGGAEKQNGSFYIDETDFHKISSPEEENKRPPSSLLSDDSGTSAVVQKTTPPTSPVSDEDRTPTNSPKSSPFLSPITHLGSSTPFADSGNKSSSILAEGAKTPKQDSPPLPHPLASSSNSNLPDLISPDVRSAHPNGKKQVLDLEAWVAGLNPTIKVWNDDEDDYEDDDESTQRDEDSNYDSDSGESSVTITSHMSQSDHKSFCVSLSDLCNFAGVDYESDNDSDEWQSTNHRTASLSSDMSALSIVSVMPSEELDRLLEDVRMRNALVRECMAEILGTFVLLLFGCSAAAQVKTSRDTKGQFLSVNMAFSVGVMSAMYLTKGITGAHLNPAVTLSFCVLGQVPWGRLVPYCLSQLLGAYLASGLVYLVYYDAIMNFSGGVLTVYGPNETASIFATYPSEYITLGRSFLDQVVGTGMLMLCILCLDEKRNTPAPSELIPPIVAVIVLGISMSMSANCGAAINPARDLGPRLFTLTAGWGTEVFTCYNYWFWVPLVAPLIGGVIGTFIYLIFIHWHLPDPDPPESLPTVSTISEKIKQPITTWDSAVDLKAARF
ncbi:uncharacterized protein LOC131976653 [Centropristis striata]|uniref:uncharacterized protein LOC131976653 n=1 Tax=Centropristis striata TaxID=184440 RepID=UPI0027DF80FD|nr:uncharacterized protein LOC131976653 [Centropristis striata]